MEYVETLEAMKMGDEVFLLLTEYAALMGGYPDLAKFKKWVQSQCKKIGGVWIIDAYVDEITGEDMVRVGLAGTPVYREDRDYD